MQTCHELFYHASSKSTPVQIVRCAGMETVRVAVRVRPLLPAEQREAPELCIRCSPRFYSLAMQLRHGCLA